ncbi:MAG: hypothetical protein LBJ98_02615 [Endomicrobium sp.]|jgi:hypothetical protein|nr:hypothetical protein [Endomicrobium sp.]
MKRLILAVALCCAFSVYGLATNSDAKLKRIEMLEKKINALKAEREDIKPKYIAIIDEVCILFKKNAVLKDKIKSQSCNHGVCSGSCLKELLEKSENDHKISILEVTAAELELDGTKIELNINKAFIELIKAEIKAGKMPKAPIEIAKALVKRTQTWIGDCEAKVKVKQAKVKEKEANVKYLEICVKNNEIKKYTKGTYSYIGTKNIEIAEMFAKESVLNLKLEQARSETVQAKIKEKQALLKSTQAGVKFCKTFLKFEKAVDKKNLELFFEHG